MLLCLLAGLYFTIILVEVAASLYFVILIYLLAKKKIPADYFSYLILAYVLSGIISMISGGDSLKELPRMFPHFMILSYFPLTFLIQNRRSWKTSQWLQWILLFATLSAVIGIIFHFMGKERTTSTYGGYFTLANMMAWSIPFSVSLLLESKNRITILYSVAIIMQLLALWWTYTRSAMLALIGVIGIWLFFSMVKIISRRGSSIKQLLPRWIFILSLPALLTIFTLTSPNPRINPFARPDKGQPETLDLTSGRQSIFEDAIRIISNDWQEKEYTRIVFGYGQDSRYRLVNNEFTSWESDYLQIMMNQGVLGLFILLLIYYYFLKIIWRNFLATSDLLNGISAAGLTLFLMSFFTLKLTGWHSGAMFVITLTFLENHKLE